LFLTVSPILHIAQESETQRAMDRACPGEGRGRPSFFDKTRRLSKNAGYAAGGRFELDLSVFFGDFLFEKKVTLAPARKRFRAFPMTSRSPASRSQHTVRQIEG
jgi:hypothetical protein